MPLTSPTLAHPYSTPTAIRLTWDAASGGTGPYVYDVHRSLVSGFTPAAATLLAAAQTSPYDDADAALAAQRTYFYRLVTTDSLLATVNSAQVSGALEYSPGAAAGMSLTTARLWARQFARNAGSSTEYSNTDVDHALIVVGEQFARVTRCVRAAGSVALAAHSAVADFSGLTAFRPERILTAHILTKQCELEITDWQHLYKKQIECASEGAPRVLAFETWTTANVWPTPNVDLSLRIQYWQPFTNWTPGMAGDAAISFNLPDDYMTQILTYGVPATLQHNEPEHRYASESWKKYLEFEQRMMGAGNLGSKVLIRERVR